MFNLEFYGVNFDNISKVNYLVRENEGDTIIGIFNHSMYPYIRSYFDDDEIRRRAWQKKLYYDVSKGHIVSIELICEDFNNKEFIDNMRRLENFTNLENLNILFSRTSDYEYMKHKLANLHSYKIKIYVLDQNFPYLSQIRGI